MFKLNPNKLYLNLQLKWGREKYRHLLRFNMNYPSFVNTEMYYENSKLLEPTFLYKYFSPNDNSLNSLKNNYLYFSNPKGFGDEYDCLISDDEHIKKINDDAEKLKESLGVCCFCLVNNEDLMWDYYASGFKGFVLKFKNNKQFLPYNQKTNIKSHVMYLEDNGSNNPNLIKTIKSIEGKHDQEVTKSWQKLILYHHELCRKRAMYSFEKEYRAISIYADEFDRRLPIRKKNIETIYIGNKMKLEYLNKLIPILKENSHIKVLVVKHDYKRQVIKFERAKNTNKLKEIMQNRKDYI